MSGIVKRIEGEAEAPALGSFLAEKLDSTDLPSLLEVDYLATATCHEHFRLFVQPDPCPHAVCAVRQTAPGFASTARKTTDKNL